MNASSLGLTVFNALPAFLKGTATFTRDNVTSFNPVTEVTVVQTVTASARCVSQPAKGLQSESFANGMAILEKYLNITVPAADLGTFVPRPGDNVSVGGMSFKVYGVQAVQPDGSSGVVFTVTVER